MNILINSYCNLRCPYCFADPTMEEKKAQNMTLEDFKIALDWAKKIGDSSARIIGGEPTLSPNFSLFINTAAKDEGIEKILIFSNLTFDDNIAEEIIKVSKIKPLFILPNINEFDLLIPKYRERVKNNIEKLSKKLPNFRTLGINIYRPDMDLTQWKELFLTYKNLVEFRFSIAVPSNKTLNENFDFYEYFHSFENILLELSNFCAKNNITLFNDCNNLPICCFSPETVVEFLKNSSYSIFGQYDTCSYPVIDVCPDLTVIGCFGLNGKVEYSMKLTDFNSAKELMDYLFLCGDRSDKIARKECLKCSRYRKYNISCSCRSCHLIDKKQAEKEVEENGW